MPELPEAYKGKEIPEHWKTILQKVDSIKGMPLLRNVYIENMKGVNANICIDIQGNNVHPVEGFHFKNVTLQGKQAGRIKWAKNWTAENLTIKGDDASQVKMEDCENINLQ